MHPSRLKEERASSRHLITVGIMLLLGSIVFTIISLANLQPSDGFPTAVLVGIFNLGMFAVSVACIVIGARGPRLNSCYGRESLRSIGRINGIHFPFPEKRIHRVPETAEIVVFASKLRLLLTSGFCLAMGIAFAYSTIVPIGSDAPSVEFAFRLVFAGLAALLFPMAGLVAARTIQGYPRLRVSPQQLCIQYSAGRSNAIDWAEMGNIIAGHGKVPCVLILPPGVELPDKPRLRDYARCLGSFCPLYGCTLTEFADFLRECRARFTSHTMVQPPDIDDQPTEADD